MAQYLSITPAFINPLLTPSTNTNTASSRIFKKRISLSTIEVSIKIELINFLKLQNVHKMEIKSHRDRIHPSDMKHPSEDPINTPIKIQSCGKVKLLNHQGSILLLVEDKPMIISQSLKTPSTVIMHWYRKLLTRSDHICKKATISKHRRSRRIFT